MNRKRKHWVVFDYLNIIGIITFLLVITISIAKCVSKGN